MSTAVKQFHEEEAIGKTYDFQVARRLLRYLRPYVRLLIPALVLTLGLNLLGVLQPKFTQYAIDWHILPRQFDGLGFLVALFFGTTFLTAHWLPYYLFGVPGVFDIGVYFVVFGTLTAIALALEDDGEDADG